MTSLSKTLLALTPTIFVNYSNAQVSAQKIRQKVLEKAIIDSTFIFGKWTKEGGTETYLTYLGQVTTKHRQTFKILNSSWVWGLAYHATSNILVFNDRNQYVGNYYVTTVTDLPTKMENGKLIFETTDKDCDKNLTTVLDLKNGLPKKFFRKCKGKYGDMYSFDSE
jgi:hypothetical protein